MHPDLHSTMYLFQLFEGVKVPDAIDNLHSTMYLFQQEMTANILFSAAFTFHYVSISTS